MKKIKFFSLVAIAILSSIVFVGCSCKKEIAPASIMVTANSTVRMGESAQISYSIYPTNATNTSVYITLDKEEFVSLSANYFEGNSGAVEVTGLQKGSATLTFSINGTNKKAVHTVRVLGERVALETPTDLRYDEVSESIVFKSVSNALRYQLEINGHTVEVADPQVNLTTRHDVSFKAFGNGGGLVAGTEYAVRVRAIGDNEEYFPSPFGDEPENTIYLLKLAAPTGLVSVGGLVSWEHNPYFEEGFVSYVVSVNGEQFAPQSENEFLLNVSSQANYNVKVKAVVNSEEFSAVYDSSFSADYGVAVLAKPAGLQIINNQTIGALPLPTQHTNSVFVWNAVANAVSYKVSVVPALAEGGEFLFTSTDERKIVIDERFNSETPYIFTVQAIGNNSTILNSQTTAYEFEKLENVTNVAFANETLTFLPLNRAARVEYEVVITRGANVHVERLVGGTLSLTNIATEAGLYNISIRSLAFHDTAGGVNYANGQLFETGVTFNKISSPTVSKINNEGIVYFTRVEHATVYDVYYDNVLLESVLALELPEGVNSIYNLAAKIDIEAGAHTVAFVAKGGGNTISSSVAGKINFSFTKLAKPTNLKVTNDIISWDAVPNALNYQVGENSTTLQIIGGALSYSMKNPAEENILRIQAGGNDKNVISSDIYVFQINRALAPNNVRTIDGVLYFDYDETNIYKIFIVQGETFVDLGVTITNGKYDFANKLEGLSEVEIGIKAYPLGEVEQDKLSSDMVFVNISKLSAPQNIVNTKISGTENYVLTWDEVVGAVNYRVVIKLLTAGDTSGMELSKVVSATSYNIPLNWVSGHYEINVYALGNSLGLQDLGAVGRINSRASTTYEVIKLAAPTNIRVSGGKLMWSAGVNPNSATPLTYELRIEHGGTTTYVLNGTTTYSIESLSGNYTISVRAIGPLVGNMTSGWSVANVVSKLNTVANLRVENGVIKWDGYNQTYGTGLSVVYDLYLKTPQDSQRALIAEGFTQTSYVITTGIEKGVENTFWVLVRAENHINSELSDSLTFTKLENVLNFKAEGGYLVWSAVQNAQGYEILDKTNGANTVLALLPAGQLNFQFNADGTLDAGKYEYKIRAIGGAVGSQNYVNGDYENTVAITILSPVSNVRVEAGILKWQLSYSEGQEHNTPLGYELEVYEVDNEGNVSLVAQTFPVGNTTTTFDLSVLGSGNYKISIMSVGNNNDKLNSALVWLEAATKINAELLNVRTQAGVIFWDAFAGEQVEYEIYLDNVKVNTITQTTYTPVGLVVGQEYQFKIMVNAAGYLTSSYSNELTLVKLPAVTNFKINKNANPDQAHYFSWDAVKNAGVEIADSYEITPQQVLPEFSGNAAKGVESLYFEVTAEGTYNFKIRAVGSTNNAGISYLTGEYGNLVKVVVLDKVQNISISNNQLVFEKPLTFIDSDTTADSYRIEVYSVGVGGENELIYTKNVTTTSWDLKKTDGNLLPAGTYFVEIYSVGSQNFKVTSAAAIFESLVILSAPQSLRVVGGVIDFELLNVAGHDVKYEVFTNGSSQPLIVIENNSVQETDKVNKAITETGTEYLLKLRAISTTAIYSDFTYNITVSKLAATTNTRIELKNNVSTWLWTNVAGAAGYRIIISPQDSALSSLPNYNAAGGYFAVSISGEQGFAVPTNLTPDVYSYYFVSAGNTTNVGGAQTGYLNSNNATINYFTLMGAPSSMRVEAGTIKWNSVADAIKYRLEFTHLSDPGTTITREQTQLQININTEEFIVGTYNVKLYALGNGTTTISSTTSQQLNITKNTAPENFKVLNGLLSWTVSFDRVKLFALGDDSGTLTGDDKSLVVQIFEGKTEGISSMLIKNLWPLFNVELLVNSETMLIRPSEISVGSDNFTLFYNLDKPTGVYNVSLRGAGNTPANASFEGENLSLAVEDDMQAFNYSQTLRTSVMEVYKLGKPITPVPNSQTSISGNKIYWNTVVGKNAEHISQYLIIASGKTDPANTVVHLATVDGAINTPSVAITSLTDIVTNQPLDEGTLYNVVVIALGTANSSLNPSVIYLNSGYDNLSEVEILNSPPQMQMISGEISFSNNPKAESHILRIWNNGNTWEEAQENTTDKIKREILINSDEVQTNPHLKFLNGLYLYTLENNSLFPPNTSGQPYKFTVQAIGDGINTISSFIKSSITMIKWGSVGVNENINSIVIENGAFKWKHVKTLNPANLTEYLYPTQYRVVITRTSAVTDEVKFERFYDVGEAFRDDFVYYELPDEDDFNAMVLHGGAYYPYSYQVEVSAYGSTGPIIGYGFATGNSATSTTGTRLNTPDNITTILGVINWNAVDYATGYEVFVGGGNLGEYAIIPNESLVQLIMGTEFGSGRYDLSVRAYSRTTTYLNGRRSSEVVVNKLAQPNLRINNGQVKWNNNDLGFALTTYTKFSIEGPNDFDIETLLSLTNYEFEENEGKYSANINYNDLVNTETGLSLKGTVPGEYVVSLTYVGSNGLVLSGDVPYLMASSDPISITFQKIEESEITIHSDEINDSPYNYVKWQEVTDATNYNVIIYDPELQENGYLIKFNFKYYEQLNRYFKLNGGYYEFDISAVAEYNAANPMLPQFGEEYYVYVEAYGDDSDASTQGFKVSMSNDSNMQAVTVPYVPQNLMLDDRGTITWTNLSSKTKPVLELSRLENGVMTEPELIELSQQENSYKLTHISSNYQIRIKSIIGSIETENGILAQSAFSQTVQGGFTLFRSGSGTTDEPYLIYDGQELANITYYLSSNFRIMQNISLSTFGVWTPIGSDSSSAFTGILDGNGYTVSGLTFTTTAKTDLAFINIIQIGATVKNLTINLNSASLNVDNFAIVAIHNYGTISGITTTGNVGLLQTKQLISVAGIALYNHEDAIITNSINKANITAQTNHTTNTTSLGGITFKNDGTLQSVGNEGALVATTLGGVVFNNQGAVTRAYNTGTLTVIVNAGYQKDITLGGLVANNQGGSISYAYVQVNEKITIINNSNMQIRAGGLIGVNSGAHVISNSYAVYKLNTSSIYDAGKLSSGAIAGYSATNVFENVYCEDIAGVSALGNASGAIAGITRKSQTEMKQPAFAQTLGVYFVSVTSNYPKLDWQA